MSTIADVLAGRASWAIAQGDVLERLAELPDASVHCCIMSPPYWGLRDYGTATWEGGDPGCGHKRVGSRASRPRSGLTGGLATVDHAQEPQFKEVCGYCGAVRVDRQIGLEPTPDAYVAKMVAVFRAVRRVLRRDGTCWVNLGDSYAGSWGAQSRPNGTDEGSTLGGGSMLSARQIAAHPKGQTNTGSLKNTPGLKNKDLIGVPWLVARALREPYYTGKMARERDRVWMAAMIDGEGTICGTHHVRKDDGRPRTSAHVFITNSSSRLLDEANRIWPASRSEHARPGPGHLGLLETERWIVHGIENKMLFLREIYPYLIVKRQQAILAYALLELMTVAKKLGHSPQRDETREKRALLTRLMSEANHGADVDIPSWCNEPPTLYEPGWYLRSAITWCKPNPMPESVTDRPTSATEMLFLLTRSARYAYDADAIREPHTDPRVVDGVFTGSGGVNAADYEPSTQGWVSGGKGVVMRDRAYNPAGRNKRNWWVIPSESFPGSHFAVMPTALVEPCVLAGAPAQTCPVCGAPWVRTVERTAMVVREGPGRAGLKAAANGASSSRTAVTGTMLAPPTSTTTGWRPTCRHDRADTIPGLVLDPFVGSGTVLVESLRHGRRAIGVDLSAAYCEMARRRIVGDAPLFNSPDLFPEAAG